MKYPCFYKYPKRMNILQAKHVTIKKTNYTLMKKIILYTFWSLIVLNSCAQGTNSNSSDKSEFKTLPVEEFNEKMSTTASKLVLDVRTPEEVTSGKLASAINIDYNNNNFESEIEKLDKNKPVFLYCKSGGRSGAALVILKDKGFKEVFNLRGGIMAWNAANMPMDTAIKNTNEVKDEWSEDAYNKMLAQNRFVLIDFYAQWCAPCKRMKPILNELEKKYAGKVKIIRLDVDKNPTISKKEVISGLPTILIYKKGIKTRIVVKEQNKAELEKLILN